MAELFHFKKQTLYFSLPVFILFTISSRHKKLIAEDLHEKMQKNNWNFLIEM